LVCFISAPWASEIQNWWDFRELDICRRRRQILNNHFWGSTAGGDFACSQIYVTPAEFETLSFMIEQPPETQAVAVTLSYILCVPKTMSRSRATSHLMRAVCYGWI
jgi:hypothetical protein